jgi:hypothetical protein
MRRRTFLKNTIPAATVLPAMVDGYAVKAFHAHSPLMQALMNPAIDTDHVLVIVQLSGGNDGLILLFPFPHTAIIIMPGPTWPLHKTGYYR